MKMTGPFYFLSIAFVLRKNPSTIVAPWTSLPEEFRDAALSHGLLGGVEEMAECIWSLAKF